MKRPWTDSPRGAEYIQRSQCHIERLSTFSTLCAVSRNRDVPFSLLVEGVCAGCEAMFFFRSLRRSNYALFPLIKLLISGDGFRNMERNSDQIENVEVQAAPPRRFNRESLFVHCVNPHGLPFKSSVCHMRLRKVIKIFSKIPFRLDLECSA